MEFGFGIKERITLQEISEKTLEEETSQRRVQSQLQMSGSNSVRDSNCRLFLCLYEFRINNLSEKPLFSNVQVFSSKGYFQTTSVLTSLSNCCSTCNLNRGRDSALPVPCIPSEIPPPHLLPCLNVSANLLAEVQQIQ